jgi:hypothetical protein
MPILATMVLAGGAFLQNIDDDPKELEVGYYECGLDVGGKAVPDLRVYADGDMVQHTHNKMGTNATAIDVKLFKGTELQTDMTFSQSLKKYLLRKSHLYGKESAPPFDRSKFDYILHFGSGKFCCSNVVPRRFAEANISSHLYTGKTVIPDTCIAHDVVVHFEMDDYSELRLERRDDGQLIFSSNQLSPVPRHFELQLIADDSTARKFFCDCLTLPGPNCWLPNQGHPPSQGEP